MNKLVILFIVVFAIFFVSIDAWTKGRNTTGYKPVPQQLCVEDGAGLCRKYAPNYIHCSSFGSSRGQVRWRCGARLAKGVRFGSLNVQCETYPGTLQYQGYVIKGSCGLRYTLRRR